MTAWITTIIYAFAKTSYLFLQLQRLALALLSSPVPCTLTSRSMKQPDQSINYNRHETIAMEQPDWKRSKSQPDRKDFSPDGRFGITRL